MVQKAAENLDPRIRRTRELLSQALGKLMEKKEFEQISVNDIAAQATVNRATFYDHYTDKYALLECMVGSRFHELLVAREVEFDGTCGSKLKGLVLAVSEYLAQLGGPERRQPLPHMETAIVAVIRRILLCGLKAQGEGVTAPPEMVAAAASWAIYGAVKEWSQTPDRTTPEAMAQTVATLVAPLLHLG